MRSAALITAALLAACGQTGALYLPDTGVETPVEIRGPAAAPPAEEPPAQEPQAAPEPPPAPDDEEEKEERPEPPAGS